MFIYELLVALVLALLIFAILLPTRRYRSRSGANTGLFFLPLFFLLIWAAGVWLIPIGPPLRGVYWLTFVVPAVTLLLLILAVSNPPKRTKNEQGVIPEYSEDEAKAGTVVAFSVFFWLLVAIAVIAVLARYF